MNALQNFFKTFFLTELLKGLALTGGYLFQRKITVQFPEEKTPISPRFRGLTHCADTKMTRSAASRARCARLCAQRSPSRSNRKRVPTTHAVPRVTTST